ncbi:hypothetical protein [Saccharopolyspora elongata]|uniref:Uncharacterized protein n=1 Tax=Saccharopolyspora elongata TaxID=2530387 RepID=A0A4R4Z0P7_9PSEU|nr:hypothetical protein [Saccharopolyspora elongata]TDD50920.1 hypothetical protein E1288_15645 [Saccharopolyspora elongata]
MPSTLEAGWQRPGHTLGGGASAAMRGVMRASAALVMPATLAILAQVFPAGERPKTFGAWAVVDRSASGSPPPRGITA